MKINAWAIFENGNLLETSIRLDRKKCWNDFEIKYLLARDLAKRKGFRCKKIIIECA